MVIAAVVGCGGRSAVAPGPDLAIFGESTRIRLGDPHPATTPWFDGKIVSLVGARGEPVGIQVVRRDRAPVSLRVADATVAAFAVEALPVTRPSTDMYGGSRGEGRYADGLTPASDAVTSDVAYFEISATTPGTHTGELVVGAARYPVTFDVKPFAAPPVPRRVWSYYDPRELRWANLDENACIAKLRDYGVALSTDVTLDAWPERKAQLAGFPFVPVSVGDDPATIGEQVKAWIAATKGTGQTPFAIPIDEPRDHDARVRVRALADAVRAAGGGTDFLMAVTDAPQPEYGDAIDLYIAASAAHLTGDRHRRWTYNGTPPAAGSMVLDGATPGPRTWGWIMDRYQIPIWYVWDALYWHDRHNAKRQKVAAPGKPLAADRDAVSFDDTEDHGNLDGVLVLPGCRPTLRLVALRRGLLDLALLERARACDKAATDAIAAELVPRALGDAKGDPAWPSDEAAWERARGRLLDLAGCASGQGLQ